MKVYSEVEPGSDQETSHILSPAVKTIKIVNSVIPGWDDFAPPTTDQVTTDVIVMINDVNASSEPDENKSQIFQNLQDEDKFIQSKFI